MRRIFKYSLSRRLTSALRPTTALPGVRPRPESKKRTAWVQLWTRIPVSSSSWSAVRGMCTGASPPPTVHKPHSQRVSVPAPRTLVKQLMLKIHPDRYMGQKYVEQLGDLPIERTAWHKELPPDCLRTERGDVVGDTFVGDTSPTVALSGTSESPDTDGGDQQAEANSAEQQRPHGETKGGESTVVWQVDTCNEHTVAYLNALLDYSAAVTRAQDGTGSSADQLAKPPPPKFLVFFHRTEQPSVSQEMRKVVVRCQLPDQPQFVALYVDRLLVWLYRQAGVTSIPEEYFKEWSRSLRHRSRETRRIAKFTRTAQFGGKGRHKTGDNPMTSGRHVRSHRRRQYRRAKQIKDYQESGAAFHDNRVLSRNPVRQEARRNLYQLIMKEGLLHYEEDVSESAQAAFAGTFRQMCEQYYEQLAVPEWIGVEWRVGHSFVDVGTRMQRMVGGASDVFTVPHHASVSQLVHYVQRNTPRLSR